MNSSRPSAASSGEELKRERLLRQVSLEEVSAATKISVRLLTALEQGDVRKLPAPVFIRGFIRAYSLYLGLDPIEKVNAYLGDGEPSSAPAVTPVAKPRGGSRFLRGPRSTAGTIVGGVTAVLLLLGLIANPEHRRPSVARRTRPVIVEPVSFKNVAPSNEPTPLIRQESAETSVVDENVALVLEFDDSSWVEISADGSKVFGGLVSAGESRRFAARHEFRVTLGNAGGVRVSIDGQPSARLGGPGEVVRDVRLPDTPSRG